MTVAPSETCPSAAMTTASPRRTQITVVDRIRRPSSRSSGCPEGEVEAWLADARCFAWYVRTGPAASAPSRGLFISVISSIPSPTPAAGFSRVTRDTLC